MKRHYKKYYFDDRELFHENEGLDADDFELFFSHLPEDAKIIRWGQDYSRATSYFIVEHESFEVTDETQILPEERFSFTEEWDKYKEERDEKNKLYWDDSNNGFWKGEKYNAAAGSLTMEMIQSTYAKEMKREPSYYPEWEKVWMDMHLYGTGTLKIENDCKIEYVSPIQGLDEYQKEINRFYSEIQMQQAKLAIPKIFVSENNDIGKATNFWGISPLENLPDMSKVRRFSETAQILGNDIKVDIDNKTISTKDGSIVRFVGDAPFDWKITPVVDGKVSFAEKECDHDMATYHGLTERYTYCKKCDVKE